MDGCDDLYTVLGVSRTATSDELADAFRRQVARYHPDALPESCGPAMHELARHWLRRVVSAYGVLSDPGRRASYDQNLAMPKPRSRQRIGLPRQSVGTRDLFPTVRRRPLRLPADARDLYEYLAQWFMHAAPHSQRPPLAERVAPPPPSASTATISIEWNHQTPIVLASGEIDMTNGQLLAEHLVAAIDTAIGPAVFDASDVSFLGTAGISALIMADERAHTRSRPFYVIASAAVRRAIEVIGLGDAFTCVTARSTAPIPSVTVSAAHGRDGATEMSRRPVASGRVGVDDNSRRV